METVGKGARELGHTLGSAGESGAGGALHMLLSPAGLAVIGVLVIAAIWMGRR